MHHEMSTAMRVNSRALLIKHEGLKLKLYEDTVGKKTIGVGRNLEDHGLRENEALFMLENDIDYFYDSLINSFSWFEELSEERQIVLINMAFNLGIKGLKSFKRMLDALSFHNYRGASHHMLDSKWARQVGKRAQELADIMLTGKL